jgi:hypothetical protein
MVRVRVQQRLELLHVPADCEMTIIDQKEKGFGLINHLWFLPGWRVVNSKNHDKQLTHIVRVRCGNFYNIVSGSVTN